MPLGKKECVMNELLTNEFTNSTIATILDREKTIILIENTNLSGTNYSLSYSVLASPDLEESTVKWYTLISAAVIVAGDPVVKHGITDPWDGVKVQAINTNAGEEAQIKVYINRK